MAASATTADRTELNAPLAEDRRLTRALTQFMRVDGTEFAHPPAYRVYSQSGGRYVVNAETGECSCPDAGNGYTCKHYFNVIIQQNLDPETGDCPECAQMGSLGCFDCFTV